MVAVNTALALLVRGSHAFSEDESSSGRPRAQIQPRAAFSRALEVACTGPAERRAPGTRAQLRHFDDLDAATRQMAHLAPPLGGLEGHIQPPLPTPAAAPLAATPASLASPSLDELLPALVRKIGWSSDARRCTVRIELGAGAFSGATLLVVADHGRVQVALKDPSGDEHERWRERIVARLAARGLDVDVI